MPLDPRREPSPQVESVAPEANPVAVFAIAHLAEHDGDTIAIWVYDRVGRRTTIERMAIRGDNIPQDAEVLALEAIELIRVSISGLWPARRSTAPATAGATPGPGANTTAATASREPATTAAAAPPPTAATVTAPATAPPSTPAAPAPSTPWTLGGRPDISVGVGVAALRDGGGQSTQWMGALTATARWPRGFAARASVAGLGPSVVLSGTDGTADVHRLLATLGAAWFLASRGPADLYVSTALGAARTDVTGASSDPARTGHQDSGWVSIGSAGLGAQVRLGQHIAVSGAAELVWAWSHLDVRIDTTRTGALLQPGALVTLGLQAGF
jgi:hypothetical protein